MSASESSQPSPTWAVAVKDLESPTARERGRAVCRALEPLGCSVRLVADGDPAGLQADVLLMLENLADFGIYRTRLARCPHRRPVTAVWMLETLPPASLTPEAERRGLAAAGWHDRLGLRFPKRRMSPMRKLITFRNLRQWLYKQVSGAGYRRTLRLLQRADPVLADTHWSQMRGAMQNWECLHRTRREGWLDHCIVSTQQRQRFLEERGWPAPFVPVGYDDADGCRLNLERDIEVLFLGYLRNDRRVRLLATLQQALASRGIELRVITGDCYGAERTHLLNRTRILLLLHQYAWSPAWIRFGLASACGACVVSEPMPDDRPFQAGLHYVAAAPGDMPAVIEALLQDEAERSRLVTAASELCKTSLTLHHSVRQIAGIVTQSIPP